MLVDKFNRRVDLIQIEASGACEYGCSHCAWASRKSGEDLFPTERLLRFVGVMALLGLRRARLIGGEPLLRPDIIDLVEGLGAIPSMATSLSTNGRHLLRFAEKLSGAGLQRVFVTFPTLNRSVFKSITGSDDFDIVLEGLETVAQSHKIPATLKMTVLPGVNDNEIEDVVDWSLSRGMDIYLVEGIAPGRSGGITDADILERLARRYKMTRMEGVAVNNNPWMVEGYNATVKIVTAASRRDCDTCNRLWLSAGGRLSLCSRFSSSLDLDALFDENASDADLIDFASKIALNRPRGMRCEAFPAAP